jgi:hypothetical protein
MRALVILIALVLAGCGTVDRMSAPWTVIKSDGPWAASGQRAVLESREYWASPMAAGVTSEERFRAPDGRSTDAYREVTRLFSFLEKKGSLQIWPETGAYIDSRAQRLAPYRFHLVSVFPSVAILSSHDFGAIKNRSTYALVGEAPRGALSDDRIMNHIEVGTEFIATDQLFWVSSDLDVPITKVAFDAEGGFEISHSGIELVGRKVGANIVVERKK